MSADRAWKGMSRLKKETIASRIRSWASSRRIFFALHWNSVDAFGAQRSKWKSKVDTNQLLPQPLHPNDMLSSMIIMLY